MTSYGRTRGDVVRWPDDPAARHALEAYLDALPQDSRNIVTVLDGGGLDFTGADLTGLQLWGAEFSEANLDGVRLADADLTDAWLMSATLRGADLTHCMLRKAKARGCDAQDAVLRETDLQRTEFDDANLRRTDLRGSLLHRTFLADTDLRGADLRDCKFGVRGSSAYLRHARLAGCRLDGATGSVTGPVDVGADSPQLLDGPDLQRWLADNGAKDIQVKH